MRATAEQLRSLCEKNLAELNLVVLLIGGIEFAGHTLIVALGVEESGEKHAPGLWQGTTENATVCRALPKDVVARGLHPQRHYCSWCWTVRKCCVREMLKKKKKHTPTYC